MFDEEQGQMVEFAREQIAQLTQMVETLDRELNRLESQLRKRSAEPTKRTMGNDKQNRRLSKAHP
jgi:hypothetical protein